MANARKRSYTRPNHFKNSSKSLLKTGKKIQTEQKPAPSSSLPNRVASSNLVNHTDIQSLSSVYQAPPDATKIINEQRFTILQGRIYPKTVHQKKRVRNQTSENSATMKPDAKLSQAVVRLTEREGALVPDAKSKMQEEFIYDNVYIENQRDAIGTVARKDAHHFTDRLSQVHKKTASDLGI